MHATASLLDSHSNVIGRFTAVTTLPFLGRNGSNIDLNIDAVGTTVFAD